MITSFYVTSLELRFGFGVQPEKRNFEKKLDFCATNSPLISFKISQSAVADDILIFFSDPEFYHSSIMVNASIKILQKNIFLRYWPLGCV